VDAAVIVDEVVPVLGGVVGTVVVIDGAEVLAVDDIMD